MIDLRGTCAVLVRPCDGVLPDVNLQPQRLSANGAAGRLSSLLSFCITVNLVMGSGYVTLPYAFYRAGLVLSVVVVAVLTLLIIITSHAEAEIMHRAQVLCEYRKGAALQSEEGTAVGSGGDHVFQMTELCQLFGGRPLLLLYTVALVLYLFGASFTYAILFSTSVATTLPLPLLGLERCDPASAGFPSSCRLLPVYLLAYAVIVLPLAAVGVRKQVWLQALLCALRFLVGVLMCVTAVWAMAAGREEDLFGLDKQHQHEARDVPLARWAGLPLLVPSVLYSLLLNAGVAVVAQSMPDEGTRRRQLGRCITWGMASTAALYLVMALPVVLLFGPAVKPSCNLEWWSFGGTGSLRRLWWSSLVSHLVVLFPALDVLSIAPLTTIVLADNLLPALLLHASPPSPDGRGSTWRRPVCRVVCGVPPVVCAWFVPNLSRAVAWTGAIAILVSFVVPPYLNHLSFVALTEEQGLDTTTPFSTRLCSPPSPVMWALLPLGLAIGVLVVFST